MASAASTVENIVGNCNEVIESITSRYNVTIEQNKKKLGGTIHDILNLSKEQLSIPTIINVHPLGSNNTQKLGYIFFVYKPGPPENLYVNFVSSETTGGLPKVKGLGKKLLYIISCIAHNLGNIPLKFVALGDPTPLNNSNTPRSNENQRKLFEYYNHIGYTRDGEEGVNALMAELNERALTQTYLTSPTNIVSKKIDGGNRTNKQLRKRRRTNGGKHRRQTARKHRSHYSK